MQRDGSTVKYLRTTGNLQRYPYSFLPILRPKGVKDVRQRIQRCRICRVYSFCDIMMMNDDDDEDDDDNDDNNDNNNNNKVFNSIASNE